MPTANERKALWFLALVALSGGSVRVLRPTIDTPSPAEQAALERQLSRVDSARDAREARRSRTERQPRRGRQRTDTSVGVAAPVPIDVDRATAEQIETLPGIGPALAGRIVGHRDSVGGFGSWEALCEVRGIGRATAERLRPLVTFTAPRRPSRDACGTTSKASRKARVQPGPHPR